MIEQLLPVNGIRMAYFVMGAGFGLTTAILLSLALRTLFYILLVAIVCALLIAGIML